MLRAALSVAVCVALAGVAAASSGNGALIQAARTLDRTYRCPAGVDGGIRSVSFWAQTGVRQPGDKTSWRTPPHFLLTTTTSSGMRVWAGRAVAKPADRGFVETFYAVGCARASASVPLSPKGLGVGGRASPFGDRYQCPARRTVLVRVRVEFARPVSVGERARAPVIAGAMAVRTTSGKPIAYADADQSGRARLFAASSCTAE
jgi:hypothetical protein